MNQENPVPDLCCALRTKNIQTQTNLRREKSSFERHTGRLEMRKKFGDKKNFFDAPKKNLLFCDRDNP